MSRYRAEKSTHLPAGAINRAHVYDYETGLVARRDDGRLAYFPTMAAAERWATAANTEARRSATLEPRLRLLCAATRPGSCHDRHDCDGEAYWQAEADAARVELCVALGDVDNAERWTDYYLERYGSKP